MDIRLHRYMNSHQHRSIEPEPSAEDAWVAHVNEVADTSVYPGCNSWYLGANVEGKTRVFMPYLGVPPYVEKCNEVVAQATKASPDNPLRKACGRFYQSGHRQLQEEFQSTALADRLEEIIVVPALDADAQAFISQQDHFFLTTVDADGFPTVSYKGGNSGFVQIVDETTLLFPCFDGNGMWLSMGNIADHPKIGMLFINTVEPHRFAYRAMRA